jgi:hypothetical protein
MAVQDVRLHFFKHRVKLSGRSGAMYRLASRTQPAQGAGRVNVCAARKV